ncbi:PAS domain S-box protein [Phragmitibacter flavus]|uniref:histidine kinase n=1 Tax=Phragmitibacter flavus TaxID=2576071 RepID=A0A5R8KK06_9BACT|nr:chemotaxis protein CheB [Phragmitibacter flavus]TLD71949.1 PAS domain S-box protein [Phragmitibacter flavus]
MPSDINPSSEATQNTAPRQGAKFPIVGVGASAGGLEALSQLLRAIPDNTGMGFVIVQHLAPSHVSNLAEILSRATEMPVCQVRDEPTVEANHVYVIPPGRDMIIEGGKLQLLPQVREARHRGIDQFFRSLAEDSGHQAIGVVLSGSATDGTLGLEIIKAEGGVTFAQDESAEYDSMPKSAAATGSVDFVLPPEGIAHEIARLARHPYVATEIREGVVHEPGHGRIAGILHRALGVDFTHYKANTMQRRIQRRMLVHKIETLAEYEEHLLATPGEIEALYQDVLINVTSFFRNPEAFEVLAKKIFPKVIAERSNHEPVRIWTLGCSTGEEAYSLAMLFAECAESTKRSVQLQMFASDLNASGIEKARAGRYPKSIALDVSPERLRKFFTEEEGFYRVSKSIRERVVFSRHNVLADPPFSKVDFVSCRNLLIYLEPVLQQQVLPLLHYALKPGGHLWLGSSESLGTSRALFDVEDARQKIFTRRPGPTSPDARFRPSHGASGFAPAAAGPREKPPAMLHRDAERVLLAKYVPPCVVINAVMEVVQFRGDTGEFLAPASGMASHDLLKMLREGLLVPVRSAIARAQSDGQAVREEGAWVKSSGGHRAVAIEVIPLKAAQDREAGFIVIFDEHDVPTHGSLQPPALPKSRDLRNADSDQANEIARLTRELVTTREYLQSVIEQQDFANEELQTANEEAQSTNEEMQSINEELETSKEEIQSSNEELATVNDELNSRNLELNGLNNDLNNVLASTQLSIVIVSRELRIRRFTPMAEKTLNLAKGDIGRPLSDIKLSLAIPDLEPLLSEVIDTVGPREREIQDANGHWFSLRARPYLTHDNKIDGAVVTLVDVDTLHRARDYAENIIANVRIPLVMLDGSLRVKSANLAFYDHFGVEPDKTEGRYIYNLGNGQWNIPALRMLLEDMLVQEQVVENYEVKHTFEDIGPRIIMVNASRLRQVVEDEALIIMSLEDITDRVAAATALRESEQRLHAITDHIPQLAWLANADRRMVWFNQVWLSYTGTTLEDNVGDGWMRALHPDDLEAVKEKFERHLTEGQDCEDTFPLRNHGGEYRWFLSRMKVIRDDAGKVVRYFGSNTDIHELRQAELLQSASKEALEKSARGTLLLEVLEFLTVTSEVQSPAGTRTAIHLLDDKGETFTRTITTSLPPAYADKVNGMAVSSHGGPCCAAVTRREREVVPEIANCDEYPLLAEFARSQGMQSAWSTPIVASTGRVLGTFVCFYTEPCEPGVREKLLSEMVSSTASLLIERREAEEAIRKSEEFKRSIIDSSPDCIKVLDLDGNLLSIEAGQELLGIPDITPFVGKSWIEFWSSAEDLMAARETVAAAAAGNEASFVGFFRTLHGLDKWWDVAISPILDARGQPTRLLAVSRDVTVRRELEQAIISRAEELARADRSKDEFLAMLAHELRNPLAPIRNATELLNCGNISVEERIQAQHVITRQIENMSRMLDDLLDVSRITEGKIGLRKKPLALEAILAAAAATVRASCDAQDQQLVLTLPQEPVYVDADATRIEQVFVNLLSNACKYSGNGSHITVKAELVVKNSALAKALSPSGKIGSDTHEVEISVIDDGIGISSDLLPHIFDLFVQASHTLDRAHGGLGIGLTLVKRLVSMHGGSITAHSDGPDKGATFVVRLPIVDEGPSTQPAPAPVAREASRRILVVDDNVDAAKSLALLQRRRGHVTKTAFTGPDAITAATEFLPDVVLLDIGLPGMDGFQVARKLRTLPDLKDVFLIALSGYGSSEDIAEAKRAGFDEYLVKPANLSVLRDLLQKRN